MKIKKRKLPKLVIFGDPQKPGVCDAINQFAQFARDKAEITENLPVDQCAPETFKKCDFALVFGGDGSIISVARNLKDSNVPVIGVNLGKLGFLAEFSIDELEKHFSDIMTEKGSIEKCMMLSCRILNNDTERFKSTAINDVFITAGPPFRMIELKISVNGQPLAGGVSDGLIIASPTGSTAYNLSAGGPILSGNMRAIVITPICPHSLSFRPIVINDDSKVEVYGRQLNQGTTVSIDGQISLKLEKNDVVCVEADGSDFLLVNNPERTKWDTLAAKLGWAEKPKYEK